MTDSDKRHSDVARMLPEIWDRRPFALATELRTMLSTLKDDGTAIDSGSGDGCADLWVTVDGIEYFISLRRSNKQLAKDGRMFPPNDGI